MKNGSYAGRRSIRTGPVGAGHAPPVREAAVVPPIRCAAPFPSLRRPDVSLRGAKRRGNLAVPGRTTGKPSAKSQLPPRDCTPRALPRASRSGRHVGLRPPRNDKSGGPSSFYRRPADYAGAAPGAACRSPTRRVRSARALGNSRVRMALAERRYRRNRCVPF